MKLSVCVCVLDVTPSCFTMTSTLSFLGHSTRAKYLRSVIKLIIENVEGVVVLFLNASYSVCTESTNVYIQDRTLQNSFFFLTPLKMTFRNNLIWDLLHCSLIV
jgi:hypothetical protein